MKRLAIILAALLLVTLAHGQGIPFFRNYTVEDYHANNNNYDIETDEFGNVFVANFEGLLYYDYAEWRMVHMPGLTRATVVFRATDNTIWVGGYNFFGKVVRKANGEIELKRIGGADLFRGEVDEIYEKDGCLFFVAGNAVIYQVKDDKVTKVKDVDKVSLKIGMFDVVDVEALERGEKDVVKNDTVLTLSLGDGMKAIVMKNNGIIITDDKNHTTYSITEANGLCSNDVSYATYDERGYLWGATSRGIFVIHVPSAFSRFTSREGLQGSLLSIESVNGTIYAGTDDGLYRKEGYRFVSVPEVKYACWELKKSGNGLLAATADGLFRVFPDGRVRHLTNANTMTVLDEGNQIYCGETQGVFLIQADGQNRRKLCSLDNVKKIVKDREGTIWAQSLYGTVWFKKADSSTFQIYKGKKNVENMQTVVLTDGKATIVSAEDTTPFPYPLVSYVDYKGVTWLTDVEGKKLYRWKDGKRLDDMGRFLFPIKEMPIGAIYSRENEIWLGNDKGLAAINMQVQDPSLKLYPKLYIRSVKLGSDSILWGGFGDMPEVLPELRHNENDLHFTFSLDYPSITGETQYRYRLNNGNWSSWSKNTSASFVNLNFGYYTFSVQAIDAQNRITEATSIKFRITPPFYYRWYMNLLYVLLLILFVLWLFQMRLRRLKKEKFRLEKLVQERSVEVVRLEKMATAGKLTQGLIDRILNPLNYINNFAKLSEGLVRDVKANVEDEKGNIDEENYADTMEVLDMLTTNLQKVGEHGQNTTRTLKAMEEMLKDRSGGIVPMNLMAVIRQDWNMLQEFYKQEIGQYGIKVIFNDTQDTLTINGNADQLSKTIMSILGNSIHAVVRKAQKLQNGGQAYSPEIDMNVTRKDNTVNISIRDNGIGIEKTIIDKIFDPFFTTKTTSEASGVGLYLSREIVQNHGGDILVDSVKDEYSEFVITLPVKKNK